MQANCLFFNWLFAAERSFRPAEIPCLPSEQHIRPVPTCRVASALRCGESRYKGSEISANNLLFRSEIMPCRRVLTAFNGGGRRRAPSKLEFCYVQTPTLPVANSHFATSKVSLCSMQAGARHIFCIFSNIFRVLFGALGIILYLCRQLY